MLKALGGNVYINSFLLGIGEDEPVPATWTEIPMLKSGPWDIPSNPPLILAQGSWPWLLICLYTDVFSGCSCQLVYFLPLVSPVSACY